MTAHDARIITLIDWIQLELLECEPQTVSPMSVGIACFPDVAVRDVDILWLSVLHVRTRNI